MMGKVQHTGFKARLTKARPWLWLYLFPISLAFMLPWYFSVLVFVVFVAGTFAIVSRNGGP